MVSDTLMDRKVEPHPVVAKGFEALRGLPEASRLALLTPRFMLRYPYGQKSDPISEFEFEEFTASSGLRGMLWGHPAILAVCALAGSGGKNLSIGDLPFYYMVDEHGDQIALPCTERLINTDKATQLSQYGICAVMAYKGQPNVRFAGLSAINGVPLEMQVSGKPAEPQVSLQASAQAAAGAASAAAAAGSEDEDADDDLDLGLDDDDTDLDDLMSGLDDDDDDTDLDDLMSGLDDDDDDTDLDDLMSGLDDDDDDDDGDLDDLLASFGDDDDGDDEEMDPDLAALLNSLD
jgi:type VI secretion system protein ImpC